MEIHIELGETLLARYANFDDPVPVLVLHQGFQVEGSESRSFTGLALGPNEHPEARDGRVFDSQEKAEQATPIRPGELLAWKKTDKLDKLLNDVIAALAEYQASI